MKKDVTNQWLESRVIPKNQLPTFNIWDVIFHVNALKIFDKYLFMLNVGEPYYHPMPQSLFEYLNIKLMPAVSDKFGWA